MSLKTVFPVVSLIVALGAASPAPAQCNSMIHDSGNIFAVQNNPRFATEFTLTRSYRVTSMTTYHWNGSRGAPPGTIALRDLTNNRTLGPWRASGMRDWTVQTDIVLCAGRYRVVDSNPATWSHNRQSGYRGFVRVRGCTFDGGYAAFGSGCGAQGAPTNRAGVGQQPRAGRSFRIDVGNVPRNATRVFMALGAARQSPPLDLGSLGMPGCKMHVAAPIVIPCPIVTFGVAWCTLNLPPTPGVSFYTQALVLDPRANPLGISLSAAAEARIGC